MNIIDELKWRGAVNQQTDEEGLYKLVGEKSISLYCGIDPTGDSMHIGHLIPFMILKRFQLAGHHPVIVIGGGTGSIGDPSGRKTERVLQSQETIQHNAECLTAQMKKLFGEDGFTMVNNYDWLSKISLLEFLRDYGKLFNINTMLAKEVVASRLETGISFTEFSYQLLQSYDFLHLFEHEACDLQVGASDQWGNMVSGTDLIRRKTGKSAYAFSFPLLVNKSTGKKFGKSEGGAVWLDPAKTSVFEFYQFWFNTSDAEVEEYLLKMTLVSKQDIDAVMQEQKQNPAARPAQKKLAWEVTSLVHGSKDADKAKAESEALFAGKAPTDMPSVPGGKLRDVVVGISTSELRRLVDAGAVSYLESGEKIMSIDTEVKNTTLKIGKNRFIKVG